MRHVGPIKIIGSEVNAELYIPLATFETPLFYSVQRGARVTRLMGGITTQIFHECMTRSVLLEADDTYTVYSIVQEITQHKKELALIVSHTSSYAMLTDVHTQVVGKLLYLRFAFTTGDASGHNMVTKAADQLIAHLLKCYPTLRYVSVSANICTDKKVSAINGILGRGKYVVAETILAENLCINYLRTTPKLLVDLNIKKNLIGTLLAGTVRSANAHFANMLLAFYLATGQDAANIIEGSQGIVHTEVRADGALYFSTTLPNIIVGTIGNGKDLEFAATNLKALGCSEKTLKTGAGARRLAHIAAATVLCGELSLLAAQTNREELMKSHLALERKQKDLCTQRTSQSN